MSTAGRIEVSSTRREFIVTGNPTARAIISVIKEAEETFGAKVWTWRVVPLGAVKKSKVRIKTYHIEAGMPASFPDADE